MKTLLFALTLAALPPLAFPMLAADPAGYEMWKGADLKARAKAINTATGSIDLTKWDNHFVALVERDEKNGPIEVHQAWVDVYFILAGKGSLTVGGELVNPKTTAPGEIRGTAIKGGVEKQLGAGDVVHIAAGMPHHVKGTAGVKLSYFLVKVPAK